MSIVCLYLLQVVKRIVDMYRRRKRASGQGLLIPLTDITRIREVMVQVNVDDACYDSFRIFINAKYSNLSKIIDMSAENLVQLLQIEDDIVRSGSGELVEDPLKELFLFLMQLAFERPIILKEDDERGTSLCIIRDSMEDFISKTIRIKSTGVLSEEMIATLNQSNNTVEELEDVTAVMNDTVVQSDIGGMGDITNRMVPPFFSPENAYPSGSRNAPIRVHI